MIKSENHECCPPFDPALWDAKIFEWKDKRFIRDRVRTLFHVPLTFPSTIKRMNHLVGKAGGSIPGYLCLSDHTSKWNMDLYLAVDREIPEAENLTMTGKYLFRVYEGNFRNTGIWCADFQAYAEKYGYKVKRLFMWYTTCPRCARRYGKNYVAVIGEI